MITLPPTNDNTIIKETNRFTQTWVQWFGEVYRILTGQRPITLQSLTVANLPQAADYPAALVYVNDATGGAIPAFSDGTDWRRVDTRAIVT